MARADLLHLSQTTEQRVAAVVADWKWAYERMEAGDFEPFAGQFIAVLGRQLVGNGVDEGELRSRVALEREVEGERLVILYIDAGEFLAGEVRR